MPKGKRGRTTVPKHIRRKHYKNYYMPTEEEVKEMLNAPELSTIRGIRDRAMLELMYSSALRRGEVQRLNLDDVDFHENLVMIRKTKGHKERIVPFGNVAKKYLLVYLEKSRPKWVKDDKERTFFVTQYGRKFDNNAVYQALKCYALNKRICLHSLRVACAIHMLKRGATIPILQAFLGHQRATTTQVYTRMYPKDVLDAYKKIRLR